MLQRFLDSHLAGLGLNMKFVIPFRQISWKSQRFVIMERNLCLQSTSKYAWVITCLWLLSQLGPSVR